MAIEQTLTTGVTTPAHSYVDWCAIALGTVLAAAISIVLFTFGTGIGLSLVSPYEGEGVSAPVYFVVLALWVLFVQVFSYTAGGYVAGRLRKRVGDATLHEVQMRDGAHGLGVWAFGVVIVSFFVVLGATGVGAIIGGSAAAGGAAGAASDDEGGDRTGYMVDTLFRTTGAAPSAPRAAQSVPPADPTAVAPADPAAVAPAPAEPDIGTRQVQSSDRADRDEVGRILRFGIPGGAGRGELSADNRTYAAQLIAGRTGLSQAEAEARIDTALAEAKEAADKARKAGIVTAFLLAAALLVAGAAAARAAAVGGRHRDENTDTGRFWGWY
jgi:hypothetical protein